MKLKFLNENKILEILKTIKQKSKSMNELIIFESKTNY